jgi:tetratricopeptide (TPR) repeat protein/TolB-like protein
MRFRLSVFALALAAAPARAAAQCPDGTPPPCRGAATARRPNPPLDERTWIIVPFDNVTRAADIDWLKDASVNLLYLDMSKWRDIRVIDDERVADFIRDVPEARGVPLTLQSGIAVARRAGAGKLVMGDLLRVGSRTQVVAKVFDVRSGQRLRTVRREAAVADSIMPAFGQLARGVLNVEPPAGTSLGTIGTTSVGAYQAYIAGVGYLNRWILDTAQAQFARALELDSTFALAHYKLSIVYGWNGGANPRALSEAELALRLAGGLPPREHALVAGHEAFESQHYADACGIFTRMISSDSTDVEAWYNLGECSYHDPVVVPLTGDTTRFAFRSSWNAMLRAFRRTLDIDPTYHLAFQHIQDGLLSGSRAGCRLEPDRPTCDDLGTYRAVVRRGGDSLVTEPVNVTRDTRAFADQQFDGVRQHARRRNLEEARAAAEAWLASGPTEARPRMAYVRILLRLGQVQRADSNARSIVAGGLGRLDRGTFAADRLEIDLKVGNVAEASRLADSLRAATDTIAGARGLGIIGHSVFGHPRAISSLLEVIPDTVVRRYFALESRAVLGAPADSLYDAEQALVLRVGQGHATARAASVLEGSLVWTDPRERGGRWPATDTASADPRLAMISLLATGDTSRFRRALTRYDSIAATLREEPDAGFALAGAYGHLALGDTTGALRWLRIFRDETWPHSSMLDQIAAGFTFQCMLWPRTFLLLGDLAAATGQRQEAARAYRMFIGMWEHGDPDVQPVVQRARDALARLGN